LPNGPYNLPCARHVALPRASSAAFGESGLYGRHFGDCKQTGRRPRMQRVLALVLAGGKGVRLEPLTRDRAKPAVPFGGLYRIIDFTLSNCINSGLRRIHVLTQYK